MAQKYETIFDDGKNRLYDSWEVVKLLGLYDSDYKEWEMENEKYEDKNLTISNGKITKISD